MKFEIDGGDITLLGLMVWCVIQGSYWAWLWIVLIFVGFVIRPRWDSVEGWRFWK